jgi:hypothetical protein
LGVGHATDLTVTEALLDALARPGHIVDQAASELLTPGSAPRQTFNAPSWVMILEVPFRSFVVSSGFTMT